MQLKFKIIGQTLTRYDTEKPVENSRGYLTAYFDLPSEYTGTISAYFFIWQNGVKVGLPMIVDPITHTCDVPPEVIKKGILYVGLSSTDTDIFIPTNFAMVLIEASGVPEELNPPDGTPNQFETFQNMYNDVLAKLTEINQAVTDAQTYALTAEQIAQEITDKIDFTDTVTGQERRIGIEDGRLFTEVI